MTKYGILCHKSANDGGALACMCGRDEEPWLSMTAGWRIAMADIGIGTYVPMSIIIPFSFW